MEAIEQEIVEVETFLGSATFDGVKTALQNHLSKLRRQIQQLQAAKVAQEQAAVAATQPTPSTSSKSSKHAAGLTFVPVESYSWDQGSFNSSTVTIYVELDGVGDVKDNVQVSFTKSSFDLTVVGLGGKNYRLVKENLEKDIVADQSTYVVKKNKVVLKLQKLKGEYSYDHWTQLTAKKKREETESSKKDPMGGKSLFLPYILILFFDFHCVYSS